MASGMPSSSRLRTVAGLDRRDRLVEQHHRRAGARSAPVHGSAAAPSSPRRAPRSDARGSPRPDATSGSSASAEIESRKSSGFADAAPVDVERVAQACRTLAGSRRASPSSPRRARGGGLRRQSARSATRSQAPPDIDTTPRPPATRGPVRDSRPAVITSCSRDRTRMTPSCRSAASTRRSSPTSAPVWLRAISAASALEPILSATIGLPSSAARRASARNRPRRGSTR